jgi:cobyrinic acid a,c-diamide synthase
MSGAAGAVIAAPSSGSGKTTITLGLLRYFARSNVAVSSFKVGPDYIDPGFHAAASGRPCLNIDIWAMRLRNGLLSVRHRCSDCRYRHRRRRHGPV